MAPDTSFNRLHFSVQQVFAEIRIVWQLVDIWLPEPPAIGVISPFTQKVEHLRKSEGNQKVVGGVRVADKELSLIHI